MQLAELRGQDEHEAIVGVTQYTFSAKQCALVVSSAATIRIHDAD